MRAESGPQAAQTERQADDRPYGNWPNWNTPLRGDLSLLQSSTSWPTGLSTPPGSNPVGAERWQDRKPARKAGCKESISLPQALSKLLSDVPPTAAPGCPGHESPPGLESARRPPQQTPPPLQPHLGARLPARPGGCDPGVAVDLDRRHLQIETGRTNIVGCRVQRIGTLGNDPDRSPRVPAARLSIPTPPPPASSAFAHHQAPGHFTRQPGLIGTNAESAPRNSRSSHWPPGRPGRSEGPPAAVLPDQGAQRAWAPARAPGDHQLGRR